MAPSPSRRLLLLSRVLAAGMALLLPGCGDDSAATAESAGSTRSMAASSARAHAPAAGCPREVDAFVHSLDGLRRRLAIGLSYEQYAAEVMSLRGSYDKLPIDRLTIECVTATGSPAEDALNKYIDATNAWGDCLAEASCTTAAIEPVLQRQWRVASGMLSTAR
jgi:hypothetical protein